jgi:hypothetical protein
MAAGMGIFQQYCRPQSTNGVLYVSSKLRASSTKRIYLPRSLHLRLFYYEIKSKQDASLSAKSFSTAVNIKEMFTEQVTFVKHLYFYIQFINILSSS